MTPTSRELLEAESFHRRRIVTAFLSGAPGGHEVEPRREGRTIAWAIALGLLVVAAAVVGHLMAPPSHPGADRTWTTLLMRSSLPYPTRAAANTETPAAAKTSSSRTAAVGARMRTDQDGLARRG